MVPTIRIDDEVYEWLQSKVKRFEDTPNSVLRRIASLETNRAETVRGSTPSSQQSRSSQLGEKTAQEEFRDPLLQILKKHGGELHRQQALKELEEVMADRLTDFDRSDISSGTIRWQKSAEWEVRLMREQQILKPVSATARGVWALSDKVWERD